ncbi:neutral zinc metallopeptidase [Kribbella steppae]|nr:neutral zinc metallopeptidase [Kribbella steppae]
MQDDDAQAGGTGPHSQNSYLWGPSPQGPAAQGGSGPSWPAPQAPSPWSNALPPNQQQGGARHAAQRGQQGGAAGGYGAGFSGPGSGGQIGPMGQPVQQAPTWQYPPIPIPQPPGGGRRRKQKTRTRGLLIGLVVLAVLVVGSGVTLLVRLTGDDAPQTTNTPSVQPSESPSDSPSESPSPASETPSAPAAPTMDEIVTASKLYTVGPIAASKCAEPPFAPINVVAARSYYNRLLPCVNRTWLLAMKKAGLPFRAPKVAVYIGKLSSPCGIQRSVRAAYCGANETIYLPFTVDNRYYKNNPVYARAIMLNTFAHEYGHHVQKLSGILAASVSRQQKMTPNQKLLESRRRELQATCLGAAYLGANAAFTPMRNPLLANWRFLISHTGDDYARPRVHDHGNRVSNYQWSIAGYNSKQPNSCNTYTADEARVA